MLQQETFNAIINYLMSRPFQEVAPLFQMIHNDIEDTLKQNKELPTE